ncbi:PDR/VanB family oxidoreductase [Mycobacteriaceae bacterium NPDC060252]
MTTGTTATRPGGSYFLPADTEIAKTPPDLRGRYSRDPLLVVGGTAAKAWLSLFARLARTAETREVNRIRTLRVIRREVVAHDENVVALTLSATDGGELEPWTAGAHLDLLLESGRMREYSLCGDPATRDSYRIAVRRVPDGGGGSIEVHDTLHTGSLIRIKGPRNGLPMAVPGHGSPAHRLRFVAGGIGITPILPMLMTAERLGLDWSMVYTGRSRDSIPFLDELGIFGDKITVRTDDEHGLPTAADLLGDVPGATAVYCCGPVPMLELLRSALLDRDDVELHYERFSAPPVVDGAAFTVVLARSGERIAVSPNESALAAILRRDPNAAYSCKQGFCGTCEVKVVSGAVDHRDTLLTASERGAGAMLTCVSRCADRSGDGELIIDL